MIPFPARQCRKFSSNVRVILSTSVRHCMLIMVCSIVLGKAKTIKVGMVWYELNIVNE